MDAGKLISELMFKAVRSGGAGGQHVNKVSSKVVLSWDFSHSEAFTAEEKERLSVKLAKKLNADGILQLTSDQDRSQLKNKKTATDKFLQLIEKSLAVPKNRKATKIPKAAVEQRLKEKKALGEVKAARKKPDV